MTDVPPPDESPKPRPPRGRPRAQKPLADEAVLSDEEVARRVDVRGGGAPRAPIERTAARAPRATPRRPERTGARDSLLLIGLVIVGLVAVRLFLPDGPLTASATSSPDNGATQAAVATASPVPVVTALPTGGLITLPPTEFVPTPSPEPVTAPPATTAPTAAAPTPTIKPGQTPTPTPKPTKTPAPTKTPPPGSPTMRVIVTVVNDDGGLAAPGDFTISTNQAGSSPGSFTGSSSGTTVTMIAGAAYQVQEEANTPEGVHYTAVRSSHCGSNTGGTLVAGQNVTCTITLSDSKVQVKVVTVVSGGPESPSDWQVTVTGPTVSPTSFSGSSSGVTVLSDAHDAFSVDMTNGHSVADDYSLDTSGTCSSSGLVPGAKVTCTFTYTYNPPPTPTDPPPSAFLLPALALPWRPRRWRLNRAG